MRHRSIGSALIVLVIAGGLAACGEEERPPPQRRSLGTERPASRPGLSAEAAVHVDSGNAAYRAGDYEAARGHFRSAVAVQPESEAAWFGVYMAERALGNEDSAQAALERSGDLPHPGGTLHAPAAEPDS